MVVVTLASCRIHWYGGTVLLERDRLGGTVATGQDGITGWTGNVLEAQDRLLDCCHFDAESTGIRGQLKDTIKEVKSTKTTQMNKQSFTRYVFFWYVKLDLFPI